MGRLFCERTPVRVREAEVIVIGPLFSPVESEGFVRLTLPGLVVCGSKIVLLQNPEDGPLFSSSRSQIFRLYQDYARAAGLPRRKQHPHCLKHTLGTDLVDSPSGTGPSAIETPHGMQTTRHWAGDLMRVRIPTLTAR